MNMNVNIWFVNFLQDLRAWIYTLCGYNKGFGNKCMCFKCTDGPETGDIRLSNSRYDHTYGRVYGYPEVFLSGSWVPVTVSSMKWTLHNSNVLCQELGYKG